jgi:DNA primase catalytic subunit
MTKKKEPVPREAVVEYYREHFKMFELAKIIGLDDFSRREFGWIDYPVPGGNESGKKLFKRNARFDTISDLMSRLPGIVPYKLYYGAVYQKPWKGTIKGLQWEHNELHFDIDVNESELIRRNGMCTCGNSKDKEKRKKICRECFVIVKEAAEFLIETLHEDFDISRDGAIIYFSGARGVHVHYPSVKKLGRDEADDKRIRRSMMNYLSVVKEEEHVTTDDKKEMIAIVSSTIESMAFKKRVDDMIYKWFFTRAPDRTLSKLRISDLALSTMTGLFADGKGMNEVLIDVSKRGLISDRQKMRIRESALTYRYPRYDGVSTYDVRKVLKVPRSIDCSTGYIVSKIDDLDDFDIDDVDHVANHVKID